MTHIFERLQQLESINSKAGLAPGATILPSHAKDVDGNKQNVQADSATAKEHTSVTFSNGTSISQKQQKDRNNQASVEKKVPVDDDEDGDEKAFLENIQSQFQGASDSVKEKFVAINEKVEGKLATLNEKVDDKLASLLKFAKIVESYQFIV